MPTISYVRSLLQGNKIFFETVAAAALTAMSLIVSCNSLQVSESSLAVSKQQLALSEREASPIFRLEHSTMYRADLPFNSDEAKFTSGQAELYNEGTPITDVTLKVKTVFSLSEPMSSRDWITVYNPIHVDYGEYGIETAKTGLIATFREEQRVIDTYSEFLKKMSDACDSKVAESCVVLKAPDVKTLAQISYADKFNVRKRFYFPLFSTGMPEDQDDLKKLFERFEKVKIERTQQDFAKSTPQSILQWSNQ